MMKFKLFSIIFLVFGLVFNPKAQNVPSPLEHFGFFMGQDYQLANYTETAKFFNKLTQSKRVKLVEIGKTEEDRPQYMLVISSPENIQKLEEYKEISTKLAFAQGLDSEAAKQLAARGKAVVWIDGGLHSTEMVGTHQLIQTAYELASSTDPEVVEILDNVIVLLVHANPDGQELVANWYMQQSDTLARSMDIPTLYHKYVGHDNNRDFYMNNLKETQNLSRQLFVEWVPQIMYNHHQSAPEGAVVAGPPYIDPFNYNLDPLLMTSIDAVGASMINRLNVEDKPGFTRLKGSPFSTWYNGGLRTTTYFHNMIGILSEIIGHPTPMAIPLVPERLLPNGNTPNPVTPQKWHFKQSIDYSVSLNYAVLDYASRHREQILYNIYKMGKNSIEKGSGDFWQLTPRNIDQINSSFQADLAAGKIEAQVQTSYYGSKVKIPESYYDQVFKNPAKRDARIYIIPVDQPDFPTAVKFVNTLVKSGIYIHKATADFSLGDKLYSKGSYIIKTDQAFRPHIIDMFEAQDYPNDFAYPGGPPVRPYDAAGWTLARQMGVAFDRAYESLDVPMERLAHGVLVEPQVVEVPKSKSGFLFSAKVNDAFLVINELLKAGVKVFRVEQPVAGLAEGSFYVEQSGAKLIERIAGPHGVKAFPTSSIPAKKQQIKPSRIALFDMYGGSMASGWVRWMLEQYHFSFSLIYPEEINKGDLKSKYDAILFVENGIPPFATTGVGNSYRRRAPGVEELPNELKYMAGDLSVERSIPSLEAFLRAGGTVLTTGSSTSLAYHLKLPVKNQLVEVIGGKEVPLKGEKFYVPGSVLEARVASALQPAWGMPEYVDLIFNNSPVFSFKPEAVSQGVEAILWFDSEKPLRSGWAWGQNYLQDGIAGFRAPVGKGVLYAYGPQISYRAQSHATFKLLFNALYTSH